MPSGLVFDLLAHDKASPAFTRLAGSVDKAAVATQRFATSELEANKVANRLKIAELEVAAATDRHAKASASASTSIAAQARSEIALIRANEGLASSQAAAAAATKAQRGALAGTAAMAATAGSKISKFVTLPMLAITAIGAKNAMEYQKQQALLVTAAGESEANMRQITGGIKRVSADTATSLHELYEGMYVIGKAAKSRGWTGAEQLMILKSAAQGAKAENVSLEVATDALTTTMVDFHAKAGDAVKMENQLVKASGLAKTNYALFSESLSNVTPIAAAAGLSFAEVGGAVATMTQHGVTAQRATDNLRNLIFNLTGQNNVASQAMQQLGINTVDLAQNLGKRGLTGTLAIVDDALKKHSKNGMVTVDIHKAAKLATGSLNTMVGSFSGKLKDNSQALLTGRMSLRGYQLYARSLGGTNGAAAMQFLGLTKNALGFSNQLKSGKGEVTTTVQQYQKMLGGMTGAAVAMQIAGKYAKDNAKNVREVAHAAEHAGKNVHGWERTQQTLDYKLKDASNRASLFATALGEKALPILGKMADFGTKAFAWIDGLSGTEKAVLGWSVGIIAALGPVMAIGAKVGGALFRAGSGLATFAGASEKTASRVGRSMQSIAVAMAGVGIMSIGGSLAEKSKGIGDDLKSLGANIGGGALAGAALGSIVPGLGTGVGAAIGGTVGAVKGLINVLGSAGDEGESAAQRQQAAADRAKRAYLEERAAVDGLKQSIIESNGAISDGAKAQVAANLQKKGALGLAQQAGIDPALVTNAATGGVKDQRKLQSAIDHMYLKALGPGGKNGLLGAVAQTGPMAKLMKILKDQGLILGKAGREADLYQASLGKLNLSTRKVSTQTKFYGSTLAQNTVDGRMNAAFIRDRVGALNKEYKAGKLTEEQLARRTGKLANEMGKYGFAKDKVAGYVAQFSKIPKSVATRLLADPKVAKSALGDVLRAILGLPKRTNTKLGATSDILARTAEAQAALEKLPPQIRMLLTADPSGVQAGADKAASILAGVKDKTVNIVTNLITIPKKSPKLPSLIPDMNNPKLKKAAGGVIHGPGTGTSDDVPAWLSNGEFVTREAMVRKHRGLLEAINADRLPTKLLAFAKGGHVGDVHKVKGGWAYEGKFYTTEKGAKNARNRDAYESKDSGKPVKAAPGVYRVGKGYGYEGSYYDSKKDANAARRDDRRQEAAAARYHSPEQRAAVRTDAAAYRAAARQGDLEGTVSAFKTLYEDARAAGASRKALAQLSRQEKLIVADLKARAVATERAAKVQERLTDLQSKAADLRSSVRGAFTGSFDITQSSPQMFNDRAGGGSAAAILRSLTEKASKAVAYKGLLAKLGKAGLNTAMLQQLAEAGPTAEAFNAANALAKATPKELAGINSQAKRLGDAGAGAGAYVADRVFGRQIDVAKALLNGYDAKRNPAMAKAVKTLAASMFGAGKVSGVGLAKGLRGQAKAAGDAAYALGQRVEKDLKRSLDIRSPSRKTGAIGTNAGASLAAKLHEQRSAVSKAATVLGDAAVPNIAPMGVPNVPVATASTTGGGSDSGGEVHYHEHHEWNITEADNGMDTAHKVMRRLALRRA